jgi:hypothetical protein
VATLPALVRGLAISAAAEVRAERETGVANDQWWNTLDGEMRVLVSSGRFPDWPRSTGRGRRTWTAC